MLRNSDKTYRVLRDEDDEIAIDDIHFQPIFFARDVEQLRENAEAQRA